MAHDDDKADEAPRWTLGGLVLRLVSFGGLWLVLTRGQLASWPIGAVATVAATAASYRLVGHRGGRVRLWGLVRFVPYFVRRSVGGGIDVGLRAVRPSMPLRPELVRYRLRMPADAAAAIFFVELISLLPGTLCARLGEDSVDVHVIDRQWPIDDQLAELEARVAAVFGQPLEPRPATPGER